MVKENATVIREYLIGSSKQWDADARTQLDEFFSDDARTHMDLADAHYLVAQGCLGPSPRIKVCSRTQRQSKDKTSYATWDTICVVLVFRFEGCEHQYLAVVQLLESSTYDSK